MAASSFLPIQKRTLALGAGQEASKQLDTPFEGGTPTPSTWVGGGSAASRMGSDVSTPACWRVRNTFLETPIAEPTAMQGFQRQRRSWSCPAGGREAEEREEDTLAWPVQPLEDIEEIPQPRLERAFTTPVRHLDVEEEEEEESPQPVLARAVTVPAERSEAPRPLALADLVGPQSHSMGSEMHFQGACKPCAFFWKAVGCNYGTECEFCHLCDSEERKRRNKDKRMAVHVMQNGAMTGTMPMQMAGRAIGAAPVRPSRGGRRAALGGA